MPRRRGRLRADVETAGLAKFVPAGKKPSGAAAVLGGKRVLILATEQLYWTLFVFDTSFEFLTLETTVTILDGPDAPELGVRLFRVMQHKPEGPLTWYGKVVSEEDFLAAMVEEQRLVYEFEVQRAYGPVLS